VTEGTQQKRSVVPPAGLSCSIREGLGRPRDNDQLTTVVEAAAHSTPSTTAKSDSSPAKPDENFEKAR